MEKNIFDEIMCLRLDGSPYWMASDLADLLGYPDKQKFNKVIDKAIVRCNLGGYAVDRHFTEITIDLLAHPTRKIIKDYALSRFGCHLIAQSSNPYSEGVTQAKSYFYFKPGETAVEGEPVFPDQDVALRLLERETLRHWHKILVTVARNAGIVEKKELADFQNSGYKGLYGGLTKSSICRIKGLVKGDQLLDYMGSTEMLINKYRIAQTIDKLQRDTVRTVGAANMAHLAVGREIRTAIKCYGGTLPEELPLLRQSIKQTKKEQLTLLKGGRTQALSPGKNNVKETQLRDDH
jgi:DNA-damage-inducible protein D